ncbi:unnamed protein product [Symbiodinium sp. CCMP2456]|nr:unnamed protein product [Symbiodinium sp. CCMP2456]
MLDEGLQPSAQTFGALVNAAVRVGDLSQARTWLQESRKQGVNPGVVAYTTLLKGLCEAGQIKEAQQALDDMLSSGCQPNIRTANTLLRGFRRAGEVDASLELLRRMEDEWGVPPDATSCEYAVALLCQGLRVKAARALLKRSSAKAAGAGSAEGTEGSAFVTWEGGKAAAFRNRASLWTMVAEASLLCNEPRVRARRALKRARLLRRKAAKWQKQERQTREAGPGASSAGLFAEFKERELARRAALIEDHLESHDALEAPAKHMTRLLALPQDIPDEAGAVSGQALLLELQRSFGLRGDQPTAEAKLLQRLNAIADGEGQLHLDAVFRDVLPLKVELCSGEGEWVCAQAAADAGKASWVCVENRRDRVFRTFSRALLTGVCKNLCVVAADAAVFLRMLAPGSVAYMYVNFPEPPVRRGLGDGEIEGSGAALGADAAAPHLLTAETFRSVRRVLSSDGMLLIHSDNVTYLRQLAASLDAVGGFANVSDPGPGIVRDGLRLSAAQHKHIIMHCRHCSKAPAARVGME